MNDRTIFWSVRHIQYRKYLARKNQNRISQWHFDINQQKRTECNYCITKSQVSDTSEKQIHCFLGYLSNHLSAIPNCFSHKGYQKAVTTNTRYLNESWSTQLNKLDNLQTIKCFMLCRLANARLFDAVLVKFTLFYFNSKVKQAVLKTTLETVPGTYQY